MERRGFQPPQLSAVKTPQGIQRRVRHRDKQQAHLVLGFLGTTLRDPDRFPLEVLNAVLSNQGGRLFVELRDKQGLTYALSGFSQEGLDPGALGVYLAVSPEKVGRATEAVLEELQRVTTSPLSEEELSRAKRYLIGSFEIGLQRNSAVAADMAFNERYGLGFDALTRYPGRIEAVTAQDVLRVARQYLRANAYAIGMVRPQDGASPGGGQKGP
jgi:zinc protease